MRFMMIVKHAEPSGPPPQPLMDAIAKLAAEAVQAGTMVASGGLAPTAQSARVRLSQGKVAVIDGPFTEAKEVIGGYAVFDLKSKEQAVESATRFMELHREHWPGWEGETEVRQVFGPQAGLARVDALLPEPSLQGYHLLPSVRGDLLVKLGRLGEARAEFERAASLTRKARERDLLLERARACST